MGELTSILQSASLQVNKKDIWLWNLEKSNVYSVRTAYDFLTTPTTVVNPVEAKLLWHKDIPLKVIIFAWRLFCNRLPIKDNLFRRNVLNNEARLCTSGCGSLETLNHLCFHCSTFGAVWYYIFCWLGILSTIPYEAVYHLIQISFVGSGSRVRQSILHLIWFATVWEIWKGQRVFDNPSSGQNKATFLSVVEGEIC